MLSTSRIARLQATRLSKPLVTALRGSLPAVGCRLAPSSSCIFPTTAAQCQLLSTMNGDGKVGAHHHLPHNVHHKAMAVEDAVALVRDGSTVCVSGFVAQGCAEAVVKALGERFEKTASPQNITLLFGGGPGDWEAKGLNHFAKKGPDGKPMLRRTIGSHYGQVPQVGQLAIDNEVEAWNLPMGSVSRMIRSQSTHTPGHITEVGIGTFVDPLKFGGAINEKAMASPLHSKLVQRLEIDGMTQLMYKALPIDVAIIRGTTADAQGNITCEHESLLCDQRSTAAAARNSGGIVIAQVKRLAATGSLSSRDVVVPGALVDCVVVVDPQDHDELHPMSYIQVNNPALTGELTAPQDGIGKMELNIRKLIARRAFFFIKPDKIINLGIGLPEGVANVAAEEDMLDHVTLSTEPGVFGGLPASGHNFGPAVNATSLVEMNQMFDFYDGGGLNMCFLGAAQISPKGDVNVSRMSKDKLTGPGGFIDISQSTQIITFLTPFTVKGLKVSAPGDGTLKIDQEGGARKFVDEIYETTFSGDEAVRRGQQVHYVTERCVFRRTAKHSVLELIEIAPGVDLEKDILAHMDFVPAISPELKEMDRRIFLDEKMEAKEELFGTLEDRCHYHEGDHNMYLDLFGVTLNTEADVLQFFEGLRGIFTPLVEQKGKINVVANYSGFDLAKGLESLYGDQIQKIQSELYAGPAKRFAGEAFHRARLGHNIQVTDLDYDSLYDQFDTDKSGAVSAEELRVGMKDRFKTHLTPAQVRKFLDPETHHVKREVFQSAIEELLEES